MKNLLIMVLIAAGVAQWWFSDSTVKVDSNDISFKYIVKYSSGASRSESLPLLIALHGNSDTPQNFYNTALAKLNTPARIVLIKGPIRRTKDTGWPWKKEDYAYYGTAFSQAVAKITTKFPTNGKPVLLGFSGGGGMAYHQALINGDQYTTIIPVSGQLSPDLIGKEALKRGAQVLAYHGTTDSVIPLSGAKAAIVLLRKNGIFAKLIEFKGGHHGLFHTMNSAIMQEIEKSLSG